MRTGRRSSGAANASWTASLALASALIPISASTAAPLGEQLPVDVVVLPVKFEVFSVTAGNALELQKEQTEAAERNIRTAFEVLQEPFGHAFRWHEMPDLSEEEQLILEEHVLLHDLIVGTASNNLTESRSTWKHLQDDFDMGVGEGLSYLAERSGADYALMVSGVDMNATGGRALMGFVMIAAVGAALPQGGSDIRFSLIDLRTGDIVWFNNSLSLQNEDPREPIGACEMTGEMLAEYPDGFVTVKSKDIPKEFRKRMRELDKDMDDICEEALS